MKEFRLSTEPRAQMTKGGMKNERARGRIPAVYYGKGLDATPLYVNTVAFRGVMSKTESEQVLVTLEMGGREELALVREVQHDPVRGDVLHVDFQHVEKDVPIHVSVPVHLDGTPVGVRADGGILQWGVRSLEVKCLPREIPEHLVVDVSELKIGDSIHVGDLKFDGVTLLDESKRTVASVIPPVIAKVEVPVEAPVEAVEGEEKAEEGEEEEKKEKKEEKQEKQKRG